MGDKEIKAEVSKQLSRFAIIFLSIFIGVVSAALIVLLCIVLFNKSYFLHITEYTYHYGSQRYIFLSYVLIWSIYLDLLLLLSPLIPILVNRHKRKLIELTVNEDKITGYTTGVIPFSKVSVWMPIEKVDSVAAIISKKSWFTGKVLYIVSESSVIKVPYVLNADDIVEFTSKMIEKAQRDKNNADEESI